MTENHIVRCASCGTKNRVPLSRAAIHRPICGKCKAPLHLGHMTRPGTVTDQTFDQEVLMYDGVVLVDCWAPWCGPCKMLSPILDELVSIYYGKIKILKLNVDENPITASRFQIQSIPTLLFFKSGKLVDKLLGAVPKSEIEARLNAII